MATTTTTTSSSSFRDKPNTSPPIPFDVRLSEGLGYFYSYEGAIKAIQAYQSHTGTSFCVAWCRKKVPVDAGSDLRLGAHKVFWNDSHHSRVKKCRLEFDGVPFIVLGSRIYDCQYGADRNLNHKRRYREAHGGHQRLRAHTTKKQDCPALIYLRNVVKFPDFKISGNTEFYRRKGSACLQAAMKEGSVCGERRTYVHFPSPNDHRNHSLDEARGLKLPLDPRVKGKIQELVEAGTTEVKAVREALRHFVKAELVPSVVTAPRASHYLFPRKADLQSYIQQAVSKLRRSQLDCSTVEARLKQWQCLHPEDAFFFRPCRAMPDEPPGLPGTVDQHLLLVHQSKWQQQLLDWYGQEVCIVDAVHHTLHTSLPIYLLLVRTPVDYQAAATFILQEESAAALGEALEVLRKWNPAWSPAVVLCGRREVEAAAVEQTLGGAHLLCDHQREQEWVAWLGDQEWSQDLLDHLRVMAACSSEQQYVVAEEELCSSEGWLRGGRLQRWLEGWLQDHKRWVAAWRQEPLTKGLNTFSGVQHLHHTLLQHLPPHHHHRQHLSHLLGLLLEDLLPALHSAHLQGSCSVQDMTRAVVMQECGVVEELGGRCRDLMDQIRSYTYLLQDPRLLQELYHSLLLAHNTLLDHTHPGDAHSTQVIEVCDPVEGDQGTETEIKTGERFCPSPEVYEVVTEIKETPTGLLVETDTTSSTPPPPPPPCVANDPVVEPRIPSPPPQHRVRVQLDTPSTPPRKRRRKQGRHQGMREARTESKGEVGVLPPGLFQLLVPMEQQGNSTYQLLVPVKEEPGEGENKGDNRERESEGREGEIVDKKGEGESKEGESKNRGRETNESKKGTVNEVCTSREEDRGIEGDSVVVKGESKDSESGSGSPSPPLPPKLLTSKRKLRQDSRGKQTVDKNKTPKR